MLRYIALRICGLAVGQCLSSARNTDSSTPTPKESEETCVLMALRILSNKPIPQLCHHCICYGLLYSTVVCFRICLYIRVSAYFMYRFIVRVRRTMICVAYSYLSVRPY